MSKNLQKLQKDCKKPQNFTTSAKFRKVSQNLQKFAQAQAPRAQAQARAPLSPSPSPGPLSSPSPSPGPLEPKPGPPSSPSPGPPRRPTQEQIVLYQHTHPQRRRKQNEKNGEKKIRAWAAWCTLSLCLRATPLAEHFPFGHSTPPNSDSQ